ncbi:MAG: ABC transporter permease subunit [Nocardioides sp.]
MSTTTTTPTAGRRIFPPRLSEYARTFVARHASVMPMLAALVILVLILIGAQIHFGDFVNPRTLSSLLLDNAYLLILAVGMTFVIVTGGIDLSVGSVMAFTGIGAAQMLDHGVSSAIVIPAMILGGAVIGLMIGVLVQYFDVQPFIASLAGLFLARGLAYVVSLKSIRVENEHVIWLQSTRWWFGEWYLTPTGVLALLTVVVGALVMKYTRFGRTVYAVGGGEQSARLMGLAVARTKVLVYVISGVCGGLAGLVLTAYSGAGYPRNGIGTELDVIAAVVIGGTLLTGGVGYVVGSLIGVLVYGTIHTVISYMGAEQSWMRIIIGLMLLMFIVVQRVIVVRAERRR